MTENAEAKRISTNIGCISFNCECKRGPKLPFTCINSGLSVNHKDRPKVELMDTRPVHKKLFWNVQKCKADLCYILMYLLFINKC